MRLSVPFFAGCGRPTGCEHGVSAQHEKRNDSFSTLFQFVKRERGTGKVKGKGKHKVGTGRGVEGGSLFLLCPGPLALRSSWASFLF